jgi:probable HAF family extracellular repeat protein
MKSKRGLLHFRFCVAAASLFLLIEPSLRAQQQFLVAPSYGVGGYDALAAGDFNKDGKLDIVAGGAGTIAVLLGNGDGTFRAPLASYAVPSGREAVVVADFNGDGNLDIAVTSFSDTTQGLVSIFLGNGDGTFQPRMDFQTGGLLPWTMAVGDFNGDGKLDLVIGNAQDPGMAVSVLLGNGDGTFQPAVNYSSGGSPNSVAAGDFNGDGKADLAVVSMNLGGVGGSTLSVFLNKGDGTFHARVTYATGSTPSSVVVADVNGDGKPDLVVLCSGGVSVLLGNGDGTFQPHIDYTPSGGQLIVADLNGDGKPDVALTVGSQTVAIGFGNGDGTFQAPVYYLAQGSGLVVGDFNGDHKPDLALGGGSLLFNDGKGGFKAARSLPTASTPQGVALADLNGDGRLDLLVGTASGVAVMLGNGNGTFRAEVDYNGGGTGVGDFNGDGIPDVTNGATVLLGKGDGTFGAPISTGAAAGAVAIADFNGDGKLDLAIANGPTSINVLLGKGDGSFEAPVTYTTGLGPVSIAVADFNGDGKPDLAVAFSGDPYNQKTTPGGIDVFINRGDGTFLPAVVYSSGDVPSAVTVGHFNMSGHTDLAVANGGQNCLNGPVVHFCFIGSTLGILAGNGDGTFRSAVTYPVGPGPSSIVVADFNGDNNQDVAVGNSARRGTTISVLWGKGDGTFRPRVDYHVGGSPVSLAAGDLNGDSKPDLAVAQGSAVSVLLNTASGPANVLSTSVSSTGPDFGGTVFSQPPQIMCGNDCSAPYLPGTLVTLLTQSIPGYVWTGWSGDCTGTGACVVDMNADHSVVANFSATNATFTFNIVLAGTGVGVVARGATECPSNCSIGLPPGLSVNLVATPGTGSTFAGWSGGGCNPKMIECDLTMNSDATVTATFNSTGPVHVAVPNVVGMTQATATTTITLAGLTVGAVSMQSSATVIAGSVISEGPAAGTNVSTGSAVNLVVSSGMTVPNVVGQTQAQAASAINGAGLVLGTVTQQSSSSVASGSVISESPAAGTSVAPGSIVNLVVSSGGPGGGGSGGGGGMDLLTLAALLGSLLVGLRRARIFGGGPRVRAPTTTVALVLLASVFVASWPSAQAQEAKPRYFRVTELRTLGGSQASAYGINDMGWVTGAANLQGDQTEHAVLWRDGAVIDLDRRGGLNSSAGFPFKNNLGLIAAFGQTPAPDPLGENWNFTCTVSGNPCEETNRVQRGFLWVAGRTMPMPTLGGNNGGAWGVNDLGEVVGLAETATVDPNCVAPQVLDVEAVIWNPWTHEIRALPTYPGDSVAAAVAINDRGQAVGASGSCASVSPALAAHALLWQDGSVTFLGSLGGTFSNVAYDINDRGQVVGVSNLPGDATAHAFLWEKGTMTDLGTLPGDFLSVAFSINDKGQVVGQSCDQDGNCRAFLWQKGVITDLNSLVSQDVPLELLSANDINDLGQIVGQAYDPNSGNAPAFLATPIFDSSEAATAMQVKGDTGQRAILPMHLRKPLERRKDFSLLGYRARRSQ